MKVFAFGIIAVLSFCLTAGCKKEGLMAATVAGPQPTQAVPTPKLDVTLITVTRPQMEIVAVTPAAPLEKTPTITPTPAHYAVRAGDTLVDIAGANDTTVAELLALNPEITPELLQVGQLLVMPVMPNNEELVEPAEADLPPLEVIQVGVYPGPTGKTWVLGRVNNSGSSAVEEVQLEIALPGENNVLLKAATSVRPEIIPANQNGTFGVLLDGTVGEREVPDISITGARPTVDLGNRYLDLAVADAQVTIDGRRVSVSGKLENTGEQPAVFINLVTTFINSLSETTGYHEWWYDGPLLPGESVTVQFDTVTPGLESAEYSFQAQALIQSG